MGPEEEKLRKYYAEKVGLIDVKFTLAASSKDATLEDVFGEINRMNDAIERGDCEVLNFRDLRWKESP